MGLIIRGHYPGPAAQKGEPACAKPGLRSGVGRPWAVDVKAGSALKTPVTLAAVKANPKLSKMSLVTSARLSVQPVTAAEWEIVCGMGEISN
ncbi:MAG: EVE domain-containing protein [Pseudomonadota bacterium]|nr:EVE domain-containing protein [Pseudomonadota bacterium]MDE3037205.1 EVE domain-containing protein [Pseudomonadota bacterium]